MSANVRFHLSYDIQMQRHNMINTQYTLLPNIAGFKLNIDIEDNVDSWPKTYKSSFKLRTTLVKY